MMLEVVPRDPYRYGYLLSIDRDTGLLLKSLLFDIEILTQDPKKHDFIIRHQKSLSVSE